MYLGIEIGGTKLQLGVGAGDGVIRKLWRGNVNALAGGEGIRQQIVESIPQLFTDTGMTFDQIRGVGVGFGGPTDDETQTVIKSHHIKGWDQFPLADWLTELLQKPVDICNDADVAGLAEARFGAGKGLSPIFYITVGTGIGGGLIINGEIYRGVGKGASEIGHLVVSHSPGYRNCQILESVAAGWGIEDRARKEQLAGQLTDLGSESITTRILAEAAKNGHVQAKRIISEAVESLGFAIRQLITLLCPRRIVIGGGVSLIGEELFFAPLRQAVVTEAFAAFTGLTDIVPAALGEEVVVHGALALAKQRFEN